MRAKYALNSLTQGLAYAMTSLDIRVNAIAPCVTATNMTGYSMENLYRQDSPIGRVYLPEEIANTATFLLSDASGCISGQIVVCNNAKTVNARWK